MIFADLPAGEAVFLDANTLIYHFTRDPVYGVACSHLLQRIENQEIRGWTSTHILTETSHRIMTIEAIAAFGWPVAGIARRLRRHPGQVQQLTVFRQAVEWVSQSRIVVITIPNGLDSRRGGRQSTNRTAQQRRPAHRRDASERPNPPRQQ